MENVQPTLDEIIQSKKESTDYYTIKHGLNTERDCFEAIEALGHRKFVLKDEINKAIKRGDDPNSDAMKKMVFAAEEIHRMQLQVINDVCARFEVIHPEFANPSKELLQKKRLYWDWYREQYQKYYGVPAPEV